MSKDLSANWKLLKTIKVFWQRIEKKQLYGQEQYKNESEDEKQKLVEYRKKYYAIVKNKNASEIKTGCCFLI